jgi:hypothetical protein
MILKNIKTSIAIIGILLISLFFLYYHSNLFIDYSRLPFYFGIHAVIYSILLILFYSVKNDQEIKLVEKIIYFLYSILSISFILAMIILYLFLIYFFSEI